MSKPIEKNLLPFVVSPQTNGDFNDDLEKASVFCIAEVGREKGGGFFKKQDAEKLVFVSKVDYPFWLVPFRELTLLLDGLNIASHIITYSEVPDLKAFKETLKGQPITRQVYANFVSDNQNYFLDSGDQQKSVIEGLINDSEVYSEFLNYVEEATKTDSPIVDAVLVTPALSNTEVSKMLRNVENTLKQLAEELADLNEIIKLLNSRKQEAQADLREEIKAIEKEFSVKIQKTKAILDTELSTINKWYMDKDKELSNKFEEQTKALHKDILTLEKLKEELEADIERAEAEIKTSAINKDESSEEKWKEKLEELKRKRPEINSKIKALEKEISEAEETHKNERFQLRQDNDAKIKEASKDLVEIETSRDAEVKVYQNEMEKIEELTSNIITKVDEVAKSRESVLFEYEKLGIKQKREEGLLIYMPFYLSCYQSKSRKRYTYVPPSVISNSGLSAKLKAFGKTKITQIFQPRNKKSTLILNSFIGLLDENIVFNHEISEACLKTNLLQNQKNSRDN